MKLHTLPCRHIIFLIHPCCWEALDQDYVREYNQEIYVEIERTVKGRWIRAVEQKPEDTLFVQLGGPEYLAAAAREHLGDEYTLLLTSQFPEGGSLKQYYTVLAAEVKDHVLKHNLAFDPETVSSELWGESFEGCVPGYGGAFAEYLGLKQPPKMRFEMTVHDSRFLVGFHRMAKVPISDSDIEAWIFECHDGSSAAIYQGRMTAQWIDERRISIELNNRRNQVCTKLGHTVWPEKPWKKGDREQMNRYSMTLADAIWYWIRAISMSFDELKAVIQNTSRVDSNRSKLSQ